MLKATSNWVQIEVKSNPKGFMVADSSLLEGKVISVGDFVEIFKKGQKVLFPSVHGKVMEHSAEGIKYYFVDKDVILAVE